MRLRIVLALLLAACAGDSEAPPFCPGAPDELVAPAAQPAVTLPASVDFQLDSGMRVFLVPNREVPLVSFSVRVAGGSVEDPDGREGATALLAALLVKGAGERDAPAFQDAVEFVGGSFSSGAAHRWIGVSAEFLAGDVELGLDLLADVLRRPRLDATEFEKERGLARDAIHAARDQPNSLLATYYRAWLLRGHPFARPPGGDETSLEALELADVRGVADRQLGPGRVWLAVAGDFDPDAMRAAVEARFGDWTHVTPELPAVPPVPRPSERRVLLVEKSDALQTYFRFGNVGIDWSHPDYPARYLANTILGGRFTSRLNTALRIESGLSYGARSGFDDDHFGVFSVRSYTATKTSGEALALADEVYRRFRSDGITQAELDSARTYIQGQYAPDTVETAQQAAGMILALEFDGLSRATVDGFFAALDALDLDTANRVIGEHFPDDVHWVVVGRGDVVREPAGAFGEVTEVDIKAPGFGPR